MSASVWSFLERLALGGAGGVLDFAVDEVGGTVFAVVVDVAVAVADDGV